MVMDAHDHHHDHSSEALEVEESGGKLLASILITSATLIAEVVGGILTGSLALLSDAAGCDRQAQFRILPHESAGSVY